nr:MAG TPA: hypothetical protein [Caudoviricetes sp.]
MRSDIRPSSGRIPPPESLAAVLAATQWLPVFCQSTQSPSASSRLALSQF